GRLGLGLRQLLRKVGADDVDLAALLGGELLATSLFVKLDRLLTLLDQLLQQAEQVVVGERWLALPLRLEVGVLEGGVDQAQRRHPALVAGLHRPLQGGVDLVAQHGYGLSQNRAARMLSRSRRRRLLADLGAR